MNQKTVFVRCKVSPGDYVLGSHGRSSRTERAHCSSLILSDEGIRKALASGELKIDPAPADDQYTTSSVDLTLGSVFQVWDKSRLDAPGVYVELDLADQKFAQPSDAYIVSADVDANGCCILPPYHKEPRLLLAITRERIHLVPGSRLAARVEGRRSVARLGCVVVLSAPA